MQKNYGIGPGVNIVSLHIVSVYLRLQDDRARKYALHLRYREKLQEDWARAAAAKHAAESSEHAFSHLDDSCMNSVTSTNGAGNVNDERIIVARRTYGKNHVISQDLDSLYERFCNASWEGETAS